MQRGLQTQSPGGPNSGRLQVGQPRTSTPGGRGISPRNEPRSPTASSQSFDQGATGSSGGGGTANGGGSSVWEMAAGGQSFLLPQRGGPADPLNESMNSGTGVADSSSRGGGPGSRQLTPGGKREEGGPGVSSRRELTPQGNKSPHPRELTPGAAPSMRSQGPGSRGMIRELTPPAGPTVSSNFRGMGDGAGRRPSGVGQGAPLSGRNPSPAAQQAASQAGMPAYNMQSAQFGSGSSQSVGRITPTGERPQLTPLTGTPPQPQMSLDSGRNRMAVQSELEAKLRDSESLNAELNKKMDEHGIQFLEALDGMEAQVEELTRQNRKLVEEREQIEELLQQGGDGEMRAKVIKFERERQDMMQQLEEFQLEMDEDLRRERETSEKLRRQLEESEQESRRKSAEQEREKESLVEMVALEGQESQARIEKLVREKESLNSELAKALARAEAGGADEGGQAGGGALPSSSQSMSEASSQLKVVIGEREALRDEVTKAGGQILLLQSQLEIRDRKLRIADMENAMLKSELEVLRRNAASKKDAN